MVAEKDTRVTEIIDIQASLKTVWQVLSTLEDFPEIDPIFKRVDFLTPQKQGLGAMSRWLFTNIENEEVSRIEIVVEYKEHQYYTYRVLAGAAPKDCTLIFKEIPSGTRVVFTEFLRYPDPDVEMVAKGMRLQLAGAKKKAELMATK